MAAFCSFVWRFLGDTDDNDADRGLIQSRTSHVEEGIPAGAVTTYSYDSLNRVTEVVEVDGDGDVNASWEGLFHSHVIEWRAKIEAGTLGKVTTRKPQAKKSPEQARITELEKQLRKAESESERKDKVIADREAALETLGKVSNSWKRSDWPFHPLGMTHRSFDLRVSLA